MPPASKRDLPDAGPLQSMPPTTDRTSSNQGVSSTNTQWNENTPTSESSYLPPASQWNDGTVIMCMTVESYGNENVISSERSDAVPSTSVGLASNSGSLYAPPTDHKLYNSKPTIIGGRVPRPRRVADNTNISEIIVFNLNHHAIFIFSTFRNLTFGSH
ncbi:hypothetical protein Acr_05g0013430 [Actinidia rufa]|uniref:Uncharacterized protein n=1 Tax=Actinidia rufa TaxID=165716 RepID=A0A7J0EMJ3_9ERIC|nr:hypothetical protein Acr_05g0013430 [Actinidia rufa]